MLHSTNHIRDLAYIQLTLIPKSISVLCENLTAEPYARSHDLKDAPLMQAMKFNGGFYDWLKAHVGPGSIFCSTFAHNYIFNQPETRSVSELDLCIPIRSFIEH
jgi:hypothetical protein